MSLEQYRRKRRFDRSPEPVGTEVGGSKLARFVIQKHAARNLHYDLRLEMEGVLKSWAVPKGPSLDPRQKRLAIEVEDHPLEYLHFEGVIPAGEYGAGTVMVWDMGRWRPVDPEGYARGELKFDLDGSKLQGRWMLVHSGRRRGNPRHWLLFKEQDAAARPEDELDILREFPDSALSRRSMEQIAAERDAVWTGSADREPSGTDFRTGRAAAEVTRRGAKPRRLAPGRLPGARRARLPSSQLPMLPSAVRTPPEGASWLHEIKYDGYRMLCRVSQQEARFWSRNGHDWTDRLPSLTRQIARLPVRSAMFDGEVVAMATDGTTDFQALQATISRGRDAALRYVIFDVLYLNGYDLTAVPLERRKSILSSVLTDGPDTIAYSEHLTAPGPVVFQQACKLGAEGIVSKRRGSRYLPGRSTDWVKTKSLQSAEFIVGGYTDSTAPRQAFGALLLGLRDKQGRLRYAGRVGTGFGEDTMTQLGRALHQLKQEASPFSTECDTTTKKTVHFTRPELVVEVEYRAWTTEGMLRFPSFRGWRDDITPGDVQTTAAVTDTSETPEETDARLGNVNAIKMTHPDRVMYPQRGITKLGVATYYAQVFPWMLPHVTDRPLSLVRCPRGCDAKCFFQKHAPSGLPDAVARVPVETGDGAHKDVLVVRDLAGLLALVQFSTLEVHVWGARVDRPERPDRLVFDLDPDPELPFAHVVTAALQVKDLLDELGLVSFVATTGGKGLHVVVPIRRRLDWETLTEFARDVAHLVTAAAPGRYTVSPSKPARRGKIYMDYHRNRWGASAIAPYSTRARANAAVALPVAWDELPMLPSSHVFSVENVLRRLLHLNQDPWALFADTQQSVTQAMRRRVASIAPASTSGRRRR